MPDRQSRPAWSVQIDLTTVPRRVSMARMRLAAG
jgi:hypothetical protein